MKLMRGRVIELRNRKGMGQAKFARQCNLSRQQIIRIETEPDTVRRKHTVEKLAKGLRVETGVLTGELPMPESKDSDTVTPDPREAAESVSARVSADVRLAYDLVSLCYGITQSDLVRMAPLLLAVIAEGSLTWRQQKIDEVLELADKMRDTARQPNGSGIGHLAFAHAVYQAEEGAGWEKESIDKGDLLGLGVGDGIGFENDAYQYGFDPQEGNAFVDYLRMLAMEADSPEFVNPDDIAPGDDNLPVYRVCRKTLERVTGGSEEFRRALESREVRIPQIPDFLTYDLRSSRRQAADDNRETWRKRWFEGEKTGEHHPKIQKMLDDEATFWKELEELRPQDSTETSS